MKAVEFCYWLQGFFELSNAPVIKPEQAETIKRHLALVFKHEIDPSYANLDPVEAQAIHDGTPESLIALAQQKLDKQEHPWQHPPGPNGEIYRC